MEKMLRGSEITIINIVLDTKSMASYTLLFTILFIFLVPFLFILPLQRRYKGGWKTMKHRSISRSPKQKNIKMKNSIFQDAHQNFHEDDDQQEERRDPFNLDVTNSNQLTLGEIMGFKINGWDEQSSEGQQEYNKKFELGQNPTDMRSPISYPSPHKLTLGEAMGHIGKKSPRRRWLVSTLKGVAKFSTSQRRSQAKKRLIMSSQSKSNMAHVEAPTPLIEWHDETNDLDEPRKKMDLVCRLCMIRNTDATLIPCFHAYCRVCSREIWINRRSCPICDLQIDEVVDKC